MTRARKRGSVPGRFNRGSALVVVMILLLVFLMAAGFLSARVIADARRVKDASTRQQALYLADGALQAVSERLRVKGEEYPLHLRVDGELDTGRFEVVAVRLGDPPRKPGQRVRYVVTSKAWAGPSFVYISGRGQLWYDGLRFESIHHGPPPEAWYQTPPDPSPPGDRGRSGRGGRL